MAFNPASLGFSTGGGAADLSGDAKSQASIGDVRFQIGGNAGIGSSTNNAMTMLVVGAVVVLGLILAMRAIR